MKPRGLMIIHNFRPGPTGGAELQAERLAIRLAGMGHTMQVLTRLTVPNAPREETIQGVQVYRLDHRLPYWVMLDNANTFRFLVNHKSSFDILHAHMAFGHAVMAVVFARSFGKKAVVKIACAGEYGDLHTFSKFVGFRPALQILRQADAIVAVSREVERELLAYGFSPDRIVRIPNGVDTTLFRRKESSLKSGKTRFLLTVRRHPQKGIDIVLRAARMLQEQGLDGKFEISLYGEDYPEHDYRSMARELGVMNSVSFFPFENDILSLYQSADCFVLPSRGEGLSNALLEAMAMELAVIATSVSGTTDVVDDGKDGFLIPPDSPEALSAAMVSIIHDREMASRLGLNARRKVEQHFSLESVARKYADLYERLV